MKSPEEIKTKIDKLYREKEAISDQIRKGNLSEEEEDKLRQEIISKLNKIMALHWVIE